MPRFTYWYRLMRLNKNGRIATEATGSVIYLQRLARQAKPGARQWIELNHEPATLPAVRDARRMPYHRAFAPVGAGYTRDPHALAERLRTGNSPLARPDSCGPAESGDYRAVVADGRDPQ